MWVVANLKCLFVDFNDGASKLMCVFETTEGRTGGTFQVKSVVSTDEGTNWGQRSPVHVPSAANANGEHKASLLASVLQRIYP